MQEPRILDASHVEHAKPEPDLLLEAAEQLGVEPAHCWYVGDATWDMVAAVAAGMAPNAVLGRAVGGGDDPGGVIGRSGGGRSRAPRRRRGRRRGGSQRAGGRPRLTLGS